MKRILQKIKNYFYLRDFKKLVKTADNLTAKWKKDPVVFQILINHYDRAVTNVFKTRSKESYEELIVILIGYYLVSGKPLDDLFLSVKEFGGSAEYTLTYDEILELEEELINKLLKTTSPGTSSIVRFSEISYLVLKNKK